MMLRDLSVKWGLIIFKGKAKEPTKKGAGDNSVSSSDGLQWNHIATTLYDAIVLLFLQSAVGHISLSNKL